MKGFAQSNCLTMPRKRFFVFFVLLIFSGFSLGLPVVFHCPACKKITGTSNTNHLCSKENCTQQHHIDDSKNCAGCQANAKAAAEKAYRDGLISRKSELTKKAADLRRQILELTSGGKTSELRSKLIKAEALLSRIQSDPDLDPSDRFALSNTASSKITSLKDSISNIEARKAALNEEFGGIETEITRLNSELNSSNSTR